MIGRITGQHGIDLAAKARARQGYGAGSARNESDEASFSLFAVELARVHSELKGAPEVRQDLIDDFKRKVEAGEYNPPLEKVAYSLYLAGILNNPE